MMFSTMTIRFNIDSTIWRRNTIIITQHTVVTQLKHTVFLNCDIFDLLLNKLFLSRWPAVRINIVVEGKIPGTPFTNIWFNFNSSMGK